MPTPHPGCRDRAWAVLLVLACLLPAPPAGAELQVRLSRSATGLYEPVGITVTDPIGGIDAAPGPLQVTMADSHDARKTVYLEPTSRPGEWSGRFTPLRAGRYTGTAVLERGVEKEIGLVPLLVVRRSSRPGFLKLHPAGKRALQWTNGRPLFPVGVRLSGADLRSGRNWRSELTRLRGHGVNFLELPAEWPAAVSPADRGRATEVVDAMLQDAERTGMGVLLRLEGPADVAEDGAAAYGEQLPRWVRRWAHSPAVAAWSISGAGTDLPDELAALFVKVVRGADPYGHLVAVRAADVPRTGADVALRAWDWRRPSDERAFLEAGADSEEEGAALPGETSWQTLAVGGVGLPLWSYEPDSPQGAPLLERMRRLSQVAGGASYHLPGSRVEGVVPVDAPGSFARHGRSAMGWVVPEGDRGLNLPDLPVGNYRVRYWDPARGTLLSSARLRAEGGPVHLQLPSGSRAVFVEVQPESVRAVRPRSTVSRPAPKKVTAAAPRPRPRAAAARKQKPAPRAAAARKMKKSKRSAPPRTARKSSKKKTRAQLRAEARAAAREAARRKKRPAAKPARRGTRGSLAAPARPSRSRKAPAASKAPRRAVPRRAASARKANSRTTTKKKSKKRR